MVEKPKKRLAMDTKGRELLVELDQKYKSQLFSDQIEALECMSSLFISFPSPQIVTATFIRLAEYYSSGSNRIRVYLAKIFQRVACYVDKLEQRADVVDRLKVVLDSNDTVGRALTLRVFGSLSNIIESHLEIQHRILDVLLSSKLNEFEAYAAINCAYEVSKASKIFSESCIEVVRNTFPRWSK